MASVRAALAVGVVAASLCCTPVTAHKWPNLFPEPPAALGFESKFVEIDTGVRLHVVDRQGSDPEAPPVVFLHGFPDSWYSFALVLPLLGVERRVIAFDQRGFGLSSKPLDSEYSVAMFTGDAHKVLKMLGVQQIGVLVGHCMGSFVAWHYAGTWPSSVNQLVLIGSGTTMQGKPELQGVLSSINSLKSMTYDWVKAFQYSCFYNVTAADKWYTETILYESMLASVAVLNQAVKKIVAVSQANADELVPRITAPTLIIHGASDVMFNLADAEGLLKLLQDGTLVTVSEAGHSVQWESHGARRVAELIAPLPKRHAGLVKKFQASTVDVGEGEFGGGVLALGATLVALAFAVPAVIRSFRRSDAEEAHRLLSA